jgi:hypothetical protein
MTMVVFGHAVLSNLGWVDKGSLWRYDSHTQTLDRVAISDATYLRLDTGDAGATIAIQHGLQAGTLVTIAPFGAPQSPIVQVEVVGWTARVDGDLDEFVGHRRLYVTYLNSHATGAAGYYLIEVGARDVRVRRLDWFDDPKYDHGYQSVISVVETPSGEYVFGVQRSSDLVACDPIDLSVTREVALAGRGGNPVPFFRADRSEIWAVDYDTVVRLDAATLRVTGTWFGQQPHDGSRMFLGNTWLGPGDSEVVVARPGSGDVVALDPSTMQIRRSWRTGRQPLTAALVEDRVVARDWKTGDLLLAANDT